jgi:glycerate 2-kinase
VPGKVRRARARLGALYAAAIAAVDPTRAAAAALTIAGDRVVVRGERRRVTLPLRDGIVVVGAGKGAAGLAAGVEAVLGRNVVDGLVIVPRGYARPLARVAIAEGAHPVPDRRSRDATRRLLATLARHPRAAVIVVLTGGASSLLAAPATGLTVADERRTGTWLLASGVDIAGMNAVRKHCSTITGGRLAARLVGRPAVALVVSDVPGDALAVIGSGPTVADPTTYGEALAIVRAAPRRAVPLAVRRHLARGARGALAETPKPGSLAARACPTLLVARNAIACAGAVARARQFGFRTIVSARRPLVGPTAAAARVLARRIRRCGRALRGPLPALVIAGGETTVRLGRGAGRGGRNQELAAAVATELAGVPGWALLAAGTDGIDGPTDAAGAFADGTTARRAAHAGRPLARALARHDVHPLFAALGDLFAPGPTGTNVADLVMAIVWKDRGWRHPPRVIETSRRR